MKFNIKSPYLWMFAALILSCVACNKEGCTDPDALNYDPKAETDDGSCEYATVLGCTDTAAINFDSSATEDDGSCEYEPIAGCTDSTATNYNPLATVDDGSCEYAVVGNPCGDSINFCMDYGGVEKSGMASLLDLTSRYRIYWTEGSGAAYEQVELDMYISDTGTYDIDTTHSSGTVAFQYFHATDGVNNGLSGTLIITTWDPTGDGVIGTFEVEMEDATEVSNGNAYEISL